MDYSQIRYNLELIDEKIRIVRKIVDNVSNSIYDSSLPDKLKKRFLDECSSIESNFDNVASRYLSAMWDVEEILIQCERFDGISNSSYEFKITPDSITVYKPNSKEVKCRIDLGKLTELCHNAEDEITDSETGLEARIERLNKRILAWRESNKTSYADKNGYTGQEKQGYDEGSFKLESEPEQIFDGKKEKRVSKEKKNKIRPEKYNKSSYTLEAFLEEKHGIELSIFSNEHPEISQLRRQLEIAVRNENYESAAKIRNRIKAYQKIFKKTDKKTA